MKKRRTFASPKEILQHYRKHRDCNTALKRNHREANPATTPCRLDNDCYPTGAKKRSGGRVVFDGLSEEDANCPPPPYNKSPASSSNCVVGSVEPKLHPSLGLRKGNASTAVPTSKNDANDRRKHEKLSTAHKMKTSHQMVSRANQVDN